LDGPAWMVVAWMAVAWMYTYVYGALYLHSM